MIDTVALASCLRGMGLEDWLQGLEPLIEERLSPAAHGDFEKWNNTVRGLDSAASKVREQLLSLAPWRKGPFSVAGVDIDAEWRSDLKWSRVSKSIAALDGRNVLDVGSGNGYYALQMQQAGADSVIGIDPSLLFVMQFLAINVFEKRSNVFVLPARLHELPLPAKAFDTTFSMGVLYHQRNPIEHLQQLRETLRPGGQLVLETIYLPGSEVEAKTPESRYARMRNVWLLPSIPQLKKWMADCGYSDIEIIDQSMTTVDEQRSTEWMTFESLREALDPHDPALTVEGWPAPHRAVVTATVK
jgi:tRNA (mo5U34)-methyltransferase